MKRSVVPALALLGLLAGSAPAAAPLGLLGASLTTQGNYGTLKGRVVWGGSDVPKPKVLVEKGQAPKDPSVCAKSSSIIGHDLAVDPKTKGVRYVFVYLTKPKGKNPSAEKELLSKEATVEIDQKNCEFVPYASAIHENQPLVLKSSDPVNHNIRMSTFTNAAFNQILPPNGQVQLKLVPERLPIPLACDIHPWMHGYLMVFNHPFFAVTGEDGSFEIKGVPAGEQKIVVWQERVGYVGSTGSGKAVTVKGGGTTNLGEIEVDPSKVK